MNNDNKNTKSKRRDNSEKLTKNIDRDKNVETKYKSQKNRKKK